MKATNEITGEIRDVPNLPLDQAEEISYGEIDSWCSGPCECGGLEADGICEHGWPSVLIVAGFI